MSRAPLPDTAHGDAPMPSSFDDDLDFWDEGHYSKLVRRLKEEPLIPLGLALTCYALYGATRSMRRGDKQQTNRYFRARLYAQSFTLLVLVVGSIYYKEDREKRKMYVGLLAERRAREKNEAWLRELEVRDREEREEKAVLVARRQGRDVSRAEILAQLDREDAEREDKRVKGVEAKRAAAAAASLSSSSMAARPGDGSLGASMLEARQLRSAILGPAMRLWWAGR